MGSSLSVAGTLDVDSAVTFRDLLDVTGAFTERSTSTFMDDVTVWKSIQDRLVDVVEEFTL